MPFREKDSLLKTLRALVDKQVGGQSLLEIYVVTGVQSLSNDRITQYVADIKHISFTQQFDNVPILGVGLGNLKGIIRVPDVGDLVVVGFMDERRNVPIILGSVTDVFTQSPDTPPAIKIGEMIIVARALGSFIFFKENNDLIIRTADSSGNLDNGCKVRLGADGSFRIYNKTGHGIEVDTSGNMLLRSATVPIPETTTPGVF
jgi:hypothetical protein